MPRAASWSDAATGLAIASDVRLDNRRELIATLVIQPSDAGLPDGLLLNRAWRKWGEACPRHLVGDYAFVVWDAAERTLFCARDHIGARPFYYCLTPDRFVFASDIAGVLVVPGVPDQLDEDFVIASLADQKFYRSDRTYLSAVRRLPPAHSLTVTSGRDRLVRYWSPSDARAGFGRHATWEPRVSS
jgi:asparagine synthase (glutamine-hydrolysing)